MITGMLEAPRQETRAPTSELKRAQHRPGLGQGDEQAHLLAVDAAIETRPKCWQDFACSNRTTMARCVDATSREPPLAVGAERFFDHALGAVVLETRPGRRHVHAHVRTAQGPGAMRVWVCTANSEADGEHECARPVIDRPGLIQCTCASDDAPGLKQACHGNHDSLHTRVEAGKIFPVQTNPFHRPMPPRIIARSRTHLATTGSVVP